MAVCLFVISVSSEQNYSLTKYNARRALPHEDTLQLPADSPFAIMADRSQTPQAPPLFGGGGEYSTLLLVCGVRLLELTPLKMGAHTQLSKPWMCIRVQEK